MTLSNFVDIENKEFQYNRRQSFSASLLVNNVETDITAAYYKYSGISKTPVSSISGNSATVNFDGDEFTLLTKDNLVSWFISKDTLYETGTIEGTSGSTTITGTGTEWLTYAKVNDFIEINSVAYRITAVSSDTSLTIETALSADVTAGSSYKIANNIILKDQYINILRNVNAKLINRKDIVGLKPYIDKYEIFLGYIDDATTTTITDKTLKTFSLINSIVGMRVRIASGYGSCQESTITAYDSSTDTITFDAMTRSPSADENYVILSDFEAQIDQAIMDIDLDLRRKGLKVELIADHTFLRNLQLYRALYHIADNYEGEEWVNRKAEFLKHYSKMLNSYTPKLDMNSDGEIENKFDVSQVSSMFSRGGKGFYYRRY